MANFSDRGVPRYTIESGIPIPPKNHADSYSFGSMKVGDSFELSDNSIAEIERVRSAAFYWQHRHPPMKFSIRIVDPITKIRRCWRTA